LKTTELVPYQTLITDQISNGEEAFGRPLLKHSALCPLSFGPFILTDFALSSFLKWYKSLNKLTIIIHLSFAICAFIRVPESVKIKKNIKEPSENVEVNNATSSKTHLIRI